MENRTSKWAWVRFTLIRVGLFAVLVTVFAIVLPIQPWISAILAAIVAMCVSYIFFSRPRAALAGQIAEVRSGSAKRAADSDDVAEDAAIEDRPARS